MGHVRIPRASLIASGAAHVEVGDQTVAVFVVDDRIHAIDGRCPHRGGPLGEGTVRGRIVACPWHRWTFDVTTGRCVSHPERDVGTRQVSIDGDDVVVDFT